MVRRPVFMLVCGVATASILGTATESFAQTTGGGTRSTTSTSGGASMGSQLSSGASGSQSGTGSTASRSTGTSGGSGSMSSSGVTGSSMGPTLNAGDGSLGQRIRNSTGFVGGATSSQSGWIGGNPSSGSTSGMGAFGANNPFAQFRNMFGGGMNAGMGATNSSAQTQSVTPQLTLGFTPTPAAPMAVENSLRTQISTLPRSMQNTRNISAEVDAEGLVTLTGSVSNENDRKVLEHLIRMEPGVRSIENLVIVAPELP